MAKQLTKSEIAQQLTDLVNKDLGEDKQVSKKIATLFMAAQAELAYKQAKNTFVLPGIGKLVLVDRPARKMVMRFGPKAGQEVSVAKKKVLKFRVAKAAKDAILGVKK